MTGGPWQGSGLARLAGLCAFVVIGWLAHPAPATAEAVGETVQDVYESGNYQTDAPVGDAVKRTYRARDYQTEMPEEQQVDVSVPLKISSSAQQILRFVFITLGVVGGLLLLFFIVNALPSLSAAIMRQKVRHAETAATALAVDVDRERLEIALAEADRLARQGAYGEALHLLLLYCLNEMRRRFGLGLPPSLTSREILGLSVLPEIRRSGLSVIVSAVEISHFGGRTADETIYRACRQRCEDVVLGGAAA